MKQQAKKYTTKSKHIQNNKQRNTKQQAKKYKTKSKEIQNNNGSQLTTADAGNKGDRNKLFPTTQQRMCVLILRLIIITLYVGQPSF